MSKRNLPRSVGFTRVGFFIPTAVRIADASQAVVVTSVTHDHVDLANSMVRSGVNRFVLLCQNEDQRQLEYSGLKKLLFFKIGNYFGRDFHHANRFRRCDFKDIEKLGFSLLGGLVEPLNHLVDSAVDCAQDKKIEKQVKECRARSIDNRAR